MVVGAAHCAHDGIGKRTLADGELDTGGSHVTGVALSVFPTEGCVYIMIAEGLVELGQIGGTPAIGLCVGVLKAAAGADSVIGTGICIGLIEGIVGILTVHGHQGEPVCYIPYQLEVCGEAFAVALGVVVLL